MLHRCFPLAWRILAALLPATAAFAQDAGPSDGGSDAPADWTCDADWYDSNDGCDCGCGAPDPDCGGDRSAQACLDGGYSWCSGDQVPVDGENHRCTDNRCGDGFVRGQEACDDGNTASGDGCSAACDDVEDGYECPFRGGACVAVVCGDGSVNGEETCDDGNTASGDGCSESCQVEEGWSCREPGQPCIDVPDDWTCSAQWYADGEDCDCGCGARDTDCPDNNIDSCEFDLCPGDEEANPADPTQCIPGSGGSNEQDAGPTGDEQDAGPTDDNPDAGVDGDDPPENPGNNDDGKDNGNNDHDNGEGSGSSGGCLSSGSSAAALWLFLPVLMGARRRRR